MLNQFINKFKDNILYLKFNENRYKLIIQKLKIKNKINVIFLTNHISQWKYHPLFNIFKKDSRYHVKVIFIPDDNYNKNYLSEFEFNKVEFNKIDINLISAFNSDSNVWYDLNDFHKPDIVFFSRSLLKSKNKYSIFNFKNCLNCYVPYSLFIDNNDKLQCATLFHKILWKQFLPFKANLDIVKKYYE